MVSLTRKDALNITATWYIESEQRGEKKQSTCEKKREGRETREKDIGKLSLLMCRSGAGGEAGA
jgi:hypothetical protein